MNLLSLPNQDKSLKEHYSSIVEEIVSIAKQIRDEVKFTCVHVYAIGYLHD